MFRGVLSKCQFMQFDVKVILLLLVKNVLFYTHVVELEHRLDDSCIPEDFSVN